MKSTPTVRRELVLVGGGHSHIQVLRSLVMKPAAGARVTVVVDRPVAVYSGMVPGLVAGIYTRPEIELDVRPLARRGGARVVVAACTHVDPELRLVHLEGRPPLHYDLASINVGSVVADTDLPGVKEHAVSTRPIGRFVDRMEEAVAAVNRDRPLRLVVVGGGAGGVELAFCTRERLLAQGVPEVFVTLLEADRILPRTREAIRSRVAAAAKTRGIELREKVSVASVKADCVVLTDGNEVASDLTLWVVGAAPPPLVVASDLAKSEQGYISIRPTLEVSGQHGLFAAGDCAALTNRDLPRAGVYAVRQGPFLTDNLRRALDGRSLRAYRPQRDYISLLNLGDGTAIGFKWGRPMEGEWVMKLKDRIDRRFVERFQVLGVDGAPAAPFAKGMPAMDMDGPMACGGCAAKVGASALSAALGRLPAAPKTDLDVVLGIAEADDVSAIRRGGELIAQTVDAFPAFVDDPWVVGRVAAANALSDMQAKGIPPRIALALVTVPEDDDEEEVLFQVLAGARSLLDIEGVALLGGHSTVGPQLVVGFCVTGYAPSGAVARKGGLNDGDILVLTRPLGTGVLFHADMAGEAAGPWIDEALHWMLRGNGPGGRVLAALGVGAATDITGFGFAGHLMEMLRPSKCAAELDLDSFPALRGSLGLFTRGDRSTFHDANRRLDRGVSATPAQRADPRFELLFDPQTAGPLLVAVPEQGLAELLNALRETGEDPVVVGRVVSDPDGAGVIHLRR